MEKLKLTYEELLIFLNVLKQSDQALFVTKLEAQFCTLTIKDLIQKFMSKLIKQKTNYKLELTPIEFLALNQVLPQIKVLDLYSESVLSNIHMQINQQCLNI